MYNPLLSIVVPTYNRADYLSNFFSKHLELVSHYGIRIFICDNNSTDKTRQVVAEWSKRSDLIIYKKNEANVGAVKNVEIALKSSDSEYVWLIGDTYSFDLSGISKLISIISEDEYGLVVLNLEGRVKITRNKIYNDKNRLLHDLGGLMSCIGTMVYSKKILSNANFTKHSLSYFPHTMLAYDSLSSESLVCWLPGVSIRPIRDIQHKKINWSATNRVFEIGAKNWVDSIMSLNSTYCISSKLKACRDFGLISGLFTVKSLFLLRYRGVLNLEVLGLYKEYLQFSIVTPRVIVYFIAMIPRSILGVPYRLAIKLDSRFRTDFHGT